MKLRIKAKKILSLIIIVMLLAGISPINDISIKANAVSTLSLEQLKAKFPAGKHWNHYCSSISDTSNYCRDKGLNCYENSVTDSECWSHSTSGTSAYVGHIDCNRFDGGTQCFGFALKLGYDAYGSSPRNWGRAYNLNNVKAGDIINYDGSNPGHTVFVTAVSGDTVYYGDCNWGERCLIRWDKSKKKSEFNNIVSVYVAPSELSGSNPNPCSCSTSYAGEYTTKGVNSTLTIRSGHGTSYSAIGSIPANAKFTVSKADGSWAHITYNGTTGYVSYGYIQRVANNQKETRYPTPFKAYCISDDNVQAYDGVNGNKAGSIYGKTDRCLILDVYTNGWAKVNCPWEGYSNGKEVYVPFSVFLSDTSYTPKKATAVNRTAAYWIYNGTSSPGDVYVGDTCTIIGERGDQYCVICPWTAGDYNGGYMVWCSKSAFVHNHSYGNWSNYDSSYHARKCDCGNVDKSVHTWNSGVISVFPGCENEGTKTFTCTVCSATKTQKIAAIGHSYDSGINTVEATCKETGIKIFTCTNCGGSYNTTIPVNPANHTISNWISDKEAAINVPGSRHKECTACGAIISREEIPALEDVSPKGTISINSVTANRGENVNVSVLINDNPGINTFSLGFDYDTTRLNLINVAPSANIGGQFTYSKKAVWINSSDITYNGEILVLTFKVLDNASEGDASVAVIYRVGDISNYNEKDVEFNLVSGKVTVTEIFETEHIYSNDCDTTCNICGATRIITHSWNSGSVTKAATCTAKGVKTYTCTVCSTTKTEDIAALGHNFASTFTVDTPATCTTAGSKSKHCSRCSEKSEVTEIPATGHVYDNGADMECNVCGFIRSCNHSFGKWATETEATCTVNGIQARECTLCHSKEYNTITALGHNFAPTFTVDKTATCTTDGNKSRHCSRCSEKTDITVIPATGHIYSNSCDTSCNTCGATRSITHSWNSGTVTKAATCTAKGVKTYTCTVCSATKTEDIAAPGHNYSTSFTVDIPAGCTTAGSKSKHCSRCDAKSEVTLIPAPGHKYNNACDTTCNNCGDTRTITHSWNSGTVTKAATCTVKGIKTFTCAICSATKTEDITSLGHNYATSFTVDVNATCTTAGSKSKHCSRCDSTTDVTVIPATGHSYDNDCDVNCNNCGLIRTVTHSYTSKITRQATCNVDGVKTYTCSICGKSYTESIKAIGHNYITEIIEPTCTTSGYTTYTCTRCGDNYVADETTPAGHSYTNKVASKYLKSAATCTSSAIYYKSCSVCGTKSTSTFQSGISLGHDYIEEVTPVTCTTMGYTTYTCTRCDDTYTDDIVEASGHSFINKVASKYLKSNATCTEKAVYYKSCSTCGTKSTSTFMTGSALGHDYSEQVMQPTCTANGFTTYTCTRCDDTYIDDEVIAVGHKYVNKVASKYLKSASTCNSSAVYFKSCSVCGTKSTSTFVNGKALEHNFDDSISSNVVVLPATCTADGSKTVKCSRCDEVNVEVFSKISHSYNNIITKATLTKDGKITPTCSACGAKKTATVIAYPKTIKFSASSYTYTGKAIKPSVTVTDSKGKAVANTNYTVSYKNNTNVGTATVTVIFKGNYSGTKTLNFTIVPKQVTGLKVSDEKTTSLKLNWTKVTGAKYYKVEQSTDGKKWTTVTTTDKTSYTVSKLKAGTKYQFRVTALDSTKKIVGKTSAVLKTQTLCSAPSIKLTSTKSKTAIVTITKVTGASKYTIYKSTDNKKWTKVTTSDKLTYTLTKLTGEKKIYVKIVAVNAYKVNSADSKVVSVTVKK